MSNKKNEQWYFLSFRDSDTNTNLGCCNVVVEGGLENALHKTKILQINPGGEVRGFIIDGPELEPNRLYSRQEMLDLGYKF